MSTITTRKTDADDFGDVLPLGYRDPQSKWFVEPEVRQDVAEFPEADRRAIRRKFDRKELGAPVRYFGNRRDIADPEVDLELAVHWTIVQRCKDARRWAENSASYTRAMTHYCANCGVAGGANPLDRSSVRRRQLADGRILDVCGLCHSRLEKLLSDGHGAERLPDGRTVDEAARQLLAEAQP